MADDGPGRECAPARAATCPPTDAEANRTEHELEYTQAQSEEIQQALAGLVQISLEDIALEEQLQRALDIAFSVSWLSLESKGSVFLVGEEPGVLTMAAQQGLAAPLLSTCARVPFGRCMCGRAASLREVQHAACVDSRHDVTYAGMQPHGHYCVPIVLGDKVEGVLNLYLQDGRRRREKDVQFLRSVAAVLAGIIEHRRAQDRLEGTLAKLRATLGGTIKVVSSIVETRDPYTAGHQRRVADLARAMAEEMGLPPSQIDAVRLAGAVHDVGKVSVPAEILSYPGRLSETQMALIKKHPEIGYDILKPVEFPWPIAQIVLQHHERIDGSGYPQGLVGKNILIEARIMGVADVVEAMASHRPYRAALGLAKALDEISRNGGSLYDAKAVEAALMVFREKRAKLAWGPIPGERS